MQVKIEKQSIDQIVDNVMKLEEGTRIQVLAPIVRSRKGEHTKLLEDLQKEGFARVRIDGENYDLTDEIKIDKYGYVDSSFLAHEGEIEFCTIDG